MDRRRQARFRKAQTPDYVPPEGAKAEDAIDGTSPFIMQGDGKAWLFVPDGLMDGPLPTHYEPHESPSQNGSTSSNQIRCASSIRARTIPTIPRRATSTGDAFPFALTTYRLTEHHTAGGMSRTVAASLRTAARDVLRDQSGLARLRELEHSGWATITTERGSIEARVLVTERVRPMHVDGRVVHQIGLPYHWGRKGIVTGDSANALLSVVLDPNVHIQESKAFTCDIRRGRTPSARRGHDDRRDERMPPNKRPTAHRSASARASSPTRRSASDAKPAKSRARSGTSCPPTATSLPASRTTTPAS